MISNAEVRNLVAIVDPGALRDRLRVYDEDARDGVSYASALEKIGPFYRAQADPPALEAILRVLLVEERADRSYAVAYSLALDALKRLDDPDRKKRIFLEAIDAHRALPIVVDLLRTLGFEHGWVRREALPEKFRTLPPGQFEEAVHAALADVRRQAEEEVLPTRRHLDEYLYFWMSAADKDEPTAYLRTFLDGTNRVAILIRALIGEEDARLIEAGELESDARSVRWRLQPLGVFGLDDEARTRAATLLCAEVTSEEDRALLEWFVGVHETTNKPVDDG